MVRRGLLTLLVLGLGIAGVKVAVHA
jgi:ABC-type uncharacterized transport system substrate-binding protein